MRSHYDQVGPQLLFNFEYRASRVAAAHQQFALGFCAKIVGCDLYELSSGVLLPLRCCRFYRDF